MKWECPICEGEIIIKRVGDSTVQVLAKKDKSFTELVHKENGYTHIYCSIDNQHIIPQELQDELRDCFYDSY
jgi:hypothetical protein